MVSKMSQPHLSVSARSNRDSVAERLGRCAVVRVVNLQGPPARLPRRLHAQRPGAFEGKFRAEDPHVARLVQVDVDVDPVLLSQAEDDVQMADRVAVQLAGINAADGRRPRTEGILKKRDSAVLDQNARLGESHDLHVGGVGEALLRSHDCLEALKQWKPAILAYFDTFGASNGPTEAINGVIETTRRIARGFRNFTTYRLRCLLAAGGHRPYRNKQTNHA
jgi:hypothetical protein